MRKNNDAVWDQESLLHKLKLTSEVVNEYADINEKKLGRKGPGRRGNVEEFLLIKKETIDETIKTIENTDGNNQYRLSETLNNAYMVLRLLGTQELKEVLAGVLDSLPSLAKDLGKTAPEVVINAENIFVRNQGLGLLKNIFMHIFRNSLDHGIEAPDQRREKGKPAAGHIHLDVDVEHDTVFFRYQDDGQGLGISKLRQKGIERGLISENDDLSNQEIADFIFDSGFSTAEQVTEVSGRGVGMDAVKKFLQEVKGNIEIELGERASGSRDFIPFEFLISLPTEYIVQGKQSLPWFQENAMKIAI